MNTNLKLNSLTGKTLPIIFSSSFTKMIYNTFGWSVYQTLVKAGIKHLEIPPKHGDNWQKVLRDHVGHRSVQVLLDYAHLAILYYGFKEVLCPNEAIILSRTRHLGGIWWKFYDNPLLEMLNKFIYPAINNEDNQSSQDFFAKSIQALSEIFDLQAKIKSDVCIVGETIEIAFPDCPFCLNKMEACRIFHGIILGLMNWIAELQENNGQQYAINQQLSSAHLIILKPESG